MDPTPPPAPDGLATAEARSRFEAHGANEVAPAARSGGVRQLLATVLNPLALILLVAGGVAAAVGDYATAAVIAVVVTVSSAVQVLQTRRSDRAVRRLQDRVAVTATVKRDGAWAELPRRDIVPGDLIRLGAGDLVPADARLTEARNLTVQQAALTGESLPAEKGVRPPGPGPADPAASDRPDLVFFGTFVVSGTGTAVDRVDPGSMRKPRKWDIAALRNFMLVVGPVSSAFDLATFAGLLGLFHASAAAFQTGWFVESLFTQTLVLLVIRTAGNPFRSRPSPWLLGTVLGVCGLAVALPFTPVAGALGFVPLPWAFAPFLLAVAAAYLGAVEAVKRRFFREMEAGSATGSRPSGSGPTRPPTSRSFPPRAGWFRSGSSRPTKSG